jgi:GAF domain-containing protein
MSESHQASLLEQFERRNKELAALNAVSSALSGSLSLDELLTFALVQVLETMACDAGLVSLADSKTGRLALSAHQGLPETLCERFERYGLEGTLCRLVFEDGGSMGIGDLADGAPVDVSGLLAVGLRSYLGAPLIAKGKVLGAMCFFDRHPRRVTEADFDLMRAIGGQLATAIENARLFEQAQRQAADLTMIQKTISELTATLSFDEAICALLPQVADAVRADVVSMFLIQGEQVTRVGMYPTGEGKDSRIGQTIPLADYPLTRQVIETRQPLAVTVDDPRLQDHARKAFKAAGVTANVTIPLVGREGVLGTLALSLRQPGRAFTERDVRVLQTVADQATIALEKVRLFEQIQRRTVQFRAAAQVSRAASSILGVDQLVEESVNLIRDHFDFYYVGLFLLDGDGEFAVLRAGTGEAGRIMLESGHKLEIGGESMIGWCVAHGQARIALDVDQEVSRFDNPLLPDTRSEMALPLTSRGEIIGALTVQSIERAAFSDEDIAVLQIMADQIANAIANAQQFELAERARAEVDRRVRELDCLNEIGRTMEKSSPVEELLSWVAEHIPPAMQYPSRCIVAIEYQGETYGVPEAKTLPCQIVQSLDIGDEVAGCVYVAYTEDHGFLDGESALLGDIARRVSSYIENQRLLRETQTRVEQTQFLLRVGKVVASALESIEIMRLIAREVAQALSADAAATYMLDETGRNLRAIAGYCVPPERLQMYQRYRISLEGHPFIEEAWRHQRMVFSNDVPHDPRFDEEAVQIFPAQSALVMPMIAKDKVIGILFVVWWEEAHHLTEGEQRLVEDTVRQAATAVDSTRLFEETQQRVRELSLLFDISQELSSAFLRPKEIAESVARRLVQTGRLKCSLSLLEADGDTLRVLTDLYVEEDGSIRPDELGETFRLSEYPATARVIETLQPLVVQASDPDADPAELAYVREYEIETLVIVPLVAKGQAIGVMEVEVQEERHFTPPQLNLMVTLANQAAAALENTRLFDEAQQATLLMGERVRELDCLNDIGRKVDEAPLIPELLQWVANRVAAAMRHPEVCVAAVEFEDRAYGTAEAMNLPCQIVQTLHVGGGSVGCIYVAYTEEHDFLDEESALLGDIARRLSGYIENQQLLQETKAALGETEEQARRLALLNEMGEQLNRVANLDEILDIGAVKTHQIFSADRASVALLTAEGDSFEVFALQGEEGVTSAGTRVRAEGSEMEIAVREKRLILVADDQRDNLGGIRSFMVAPLLAGGQALGTLNVASKCPNVYTLRDGDLLLQIASLLSSAIDNRRLLEETRTRAEELAVLNELAQALAARLNVDQVLDDTYRGVSRLMDTTNFFIGLYDSEQHEVSISLNISESEIDREVTVVSADQGITGHIIHNRTSVLIEEDVAGWHKERGVKSVGEIAASWLGVPLMTGDQVLGVMAIQSYTTPRAYDEHDRDILTAVASQVAIAIQNAHLFAQTQAALEQVQALHQRYIRESWQDYLEARGHAAEPAYVYEEAEIKPISDLHLSEIDQALARRELTVGGESARDEKGGQTLTVPISLRSQPIGALAIEPPPDGRPWSEEDIALVEAVSEQLALAIENARLFEQTQYRAHREHLIRQITDKIRGQTDLDAILRTTVMELGKALRTSRAAIRLGTETELVSLSGEPPSR